MTLPHFLFQTGRMTDKDGSVYDGEWKDDMRNGKGEDSPRRPRWVSHWDAGQDITMFLRDTLFSCDPFLSCWGRRQERLDEARWCLISYPTHVLCACLRLHRRTICSHVADEIHHEKGAKISRVVGSVNLRHCASLNQMFLRIF